MDTKPFNDPEGFRTRFWHKTLCWNCGNDSGASNFDSSIKKPGWERLDTESRRPIVYALCDRCLEEVKAKQGLT